MTSNDPPTTPDRSGSPRRSGSPAPRSRPRSFRRLLLRRLIPIAIGLTAGYLAAGYFMQ